MQTPASPRKMRSRLTTGGNGVGNGATGGKGEKDAGGVVPAKRGRGRPRKNEAALVAAAKEAAAKKTATATGAATAAATVAGGEQPVKKKRGRPPKNRPTAPVAEPALEEEEEQVPLEPPQEPEDEDGEGEFE